MRTLQMPGTPMRRLTAAGLAVGAVALSACGGDDGRDNRSASDPTPSKQRALDTVKVESSLKKAVTSALSSTPATALPGGVDLSEKVNVRSVDCPDAVPLRKGQSFKCGIDADPYRGQVEVRQLDGDGKALSIHARLRASLEGVSTRRELTTTITLAGAQEPPSLEPPSEAPAAPPSPKQPEEKVKKADLGVPIELETTDGVLKVTALRVLDPVEAGEFDEPKAGHRFVGVEVQIENAGGDSYSDVPSNGAALLVRGRRSVGSTILVGGPCSTAPNPRVIVGRGENEKTCIPFELSKDTRPTVVRFTPNSGYGPQTGEWTLRHP